MAGIGFQLRRILDRDTYFASIKAYLYSALISSGPWLITIVAIGIVGVVQVGQISSHESEIFRITIVYVYAFTLIFLSIIQMPLTRYLADLLFSGNTRLYLPTYTATLVVLGGFQSLFVLPTCFFFSGWNVVYALHVYVFYMGVSFTWLAMIFLSAARNYNTIVGAFFAGLLVSVLLGTLFGRRYGLNGYMSGYTMGRVVLFFILSARIAKEFPSSLTISFEFVRYLKKHVRLILIGLFYNIGIWIDKIIYWYSPQGKHIDAFLHAFNTYDLPMYLSYLTIVPSMAMFLIRIETSFIGFYKAFYGAIVGKRSYDVIHSFKESLVEHIKLSFARLLKTQGLVTFLAFILAPAIVSLINIRIESFFVLRIGIIAAFCHAMLLILSIYILYFDFQNEALVVTSLFVCLNTVLTLGLQLLGYPYYGLGYLTACIISLITGILILMYKLHYLEFITFVRQPVK